MKNITHLSVILGVLLGIALLTGRARPSPDTGSITGTVSNSTTGHGLTGARVEIPLLHGKPRFLGTMKHEACLVVPQTIPRALEQGTLGHYREWVEACQGRGRTYAGFEVAAAQTEMVLLGALAVQLGRRIGWDPAALKVPGEPAADALITPVYRPGFTI